LGPDTLLSTQLSETSAAVCERIQKARNFALLRGDGHAPILNAHLDPARLDKEVKDNQTVRSLYNDVLEKQALSARGFHKSIRVARTIADLAGSTSLTRDHVLEALSYRRYFMFGADNG